MRFRVSEAFWSFAIGLKLGTGFAGQLMAEAGRRRWAR